MRTTAHGLQVADSLYQFVNEQVLPGTGIEREAFWAGFGAIVRDLAPKNAALLAERDRLQAELDAWHRAHPGPINGGRAKASYRVGHQFAWKVLVSSPPVPPTAFHCTVCGMRMVSAFTPLMRWISSIHSNDRAQEPYTVVPWTQKRVPVSSSWRMWATGGS